MRNIAPVFQRAVSSVGRALDLHSSGRRFESCTAHMSDTIELECIVRGRVQGVLFRDFTQRTARALRLKGEVRNLPDGTVAVRAQGGEDELHDLLRRLSKGPLLARVEIMSVRWHAPAKAFEGFSITYD